MVVLGVLGGALERPPLSLFCLLEALGIHAEAKLVILKGRGAQLGGFGSLRGSLEGPPLRHFFAS